MVLEHTIPINTLLNGTQYTAQIQIYDINNAASNLSEKVLFYCLDTPVFAFENLSNNMVIQNISISAILNYSQSNYENLKELQFELYNVDKHLLEISDMIYPSPATSTYTYVYKMLEDDTTYYLRATGATLNGFYMDTGYIKVLVDYVKPSDYSILYVTNNEPEGFMHLDTYLKVIEAETSTDDYEYINGLINLKNDYINYNAGFEINDDFTLKVYGSNFNNGVDIIKMLGNKTIQLFYYNYEDGTSYFKLVVEGNTGNYVLYSDYLSLKYNDIINVYVRRINHIYELAVFVKYGAFGIGNYFVGSQRPVDMDFQDVWIYDKTYDSTVKYDKDSIEIFYGLRPDNMKVGDIWIENDE